MDINKYIENVAKLLDVEIPQIEQGEGSEYETSEYQPETDIIILVEELASQESYVTLAHEFRHKWQWEKNRDVYFTDYKQREEIVPEKYEMQLAEIDANAFAMLVCFKLLGGGPTFPNQTECVRKLIFKRAAELSEEYGWDIF